MLIREFLIFVLHGIFKADQQSQNENFHQKDVKKVKNEENSFEEGELDDDDIW